MANFTFQTCSELGSLEREPVKDYLEKWSLKDTLRGVSITFDQKFQPHLAAPFLEALFQSQVLKERFKLLGSVSGSWESLPDEVKSVDFSELKCTAVSTSVFDKLRENRVLHAQGGIAGCLPEYMDDGYEISTQLAKTLLVEESDEYAMFSKEERQELLFLLFQHLVIGGPLNQYEDNVAPYFDATKVIYKDCVSVARKPGSDVIFTTSFVYKVQSINGASVFPRDTASEHPQNFMYVVISPATRKATILYNSWCGS
eukprot:m.355043 g.355043  ORF g.355043 m.355043 type:complete len:257 (-) comp17166_c0_seq1:2035-2805(-)